MNCDCIENTRAKLVEHFKAQAGDNVSAECTSLGINLSTGGMSLSIPYTIRGTAKSFKSIKGVRVSMIASHCPFCGRTTGRYEIGEDAGIAAAMGAQP